MKPPPDGTKQTVDNLLARISSLEYFLRAIRTELLDGFHELEEGTNDPSEDPLALAEEFGASALDYLRDLVRLIPTYIGEDVLLH